MRKRFLILSLLLVFVINTIAFEVYADEVPSFIEEQSKEEEIIVPTSAEPKNTIDDYINRGWNSEFSESITKETKLSPYQSEIELSIALGVMQADNDGNFNGEDYLSYTDFAQAIHAIMEYDTGEIEVLKDIATSRVVTVEIAVSAVVSLLGFDRIADKSGGIMAVATGRNLLSSITAYAEEPITREQFAKLIANSLNVDMMIQTSYGENEKYEIIKGNTLLSKMEVSRIEGWLNATNETNLYSMIRPPKSYVQINRVPYLIGRTQAKKLLGNYVTAYVKKVNDELVLIKIDINEKRNDRITVTDEYIKSLNKSELVYYTEDSQRYQSVNFSTSAIILYNGRYTGTVNTTDLSLLHPQTGNISVLDTNHDGVYDVIMIERYEIYIVDMVIDDKVLLKYDRGILDLNNNTERIVNIIAEGESISVLELGEWNVLSVAVSADESLYTIYASYNSVSGEVEGKTNDKIVLGENREYKKHINFDGIIELGEYYVLYLTKDGKIAAASKGDSGSISLTGNGRKYAYLRASAPKKGLGDKAEFRMYRIVEPEGEWVTLEGAETMTLIDGISMQDDGTVGTEISKQRLTPREMAEHPSIKDKPQLIVYETDISGNLLSITTAKSVETSGVVDDDVFTYNRNIGGNIRTYYRGYFGGIYQIGTAKMLRIPTDRTQEKVYGFERITLDTTIVGPLDIYDADSALCLNGIILRYVSSDSQAIESGYKTFVINKVWQALGEDGNEIYKVSDFLGNTYLVEDGESDIGIPSLLKPTVGLDYNVTKASHLKQGDVIAANINSMGYITLFRLDFRITNYSDTNYFAYASTPLPSQLTFDYGVIMKNPRGIHVVINTDDTTDISKNKPRVINGLIVLYDTSNERFTVMDSKNSIMLGDTVFLQATYYGNSTYAVVIR